MSRDTDYIVAQFSGSGDVSGPIFVAGHTVGPAAASRGQRRKRLRPGGLRRHARGRNRADPARHLPVHAEVPERAGRRRWPRR